MWIFMTGAAVSLMAHRDRPDDLLVRSRCLGDMQRLLPDAEIIEDETADYRYRAIVSRHVFSAIVARQVEAISYPNFKNSLEPNDDVRRHAYYGVYGSLATAYGAHGRPPARNVSNN